MEEGSGRRLVALAGRGGDGREQQELRRVLVGGELRRGGAGRWGGGRGRFWGKWDRRLRGVFIGARGARRRKEQGDREGGDSSHHGYGSSSKREEGDTRRRKVMSGHTLEMS